MRGSRISILPVSALLLVATEVYGLTGFPFDFKHHRVSRRAPAATRRSASPPGSSLAPSFLVVFLFLSYVSRARRHVPSADSLIRDVNTAVVSADVRLFARLELIRTSCAPKVTRPRLRRAFLSIGGRSVVPEDRALTEYFHDDLKF